MRADRLFGAAAMVIGLVFAGMWGSGGLEGTEAKGSRAPGENPPPDETRTTVPLPIDGITVSAESVSLRGTRLTAKGDVRLEFEEPEGLTVEAERVEYELGGRQVVLRGPNWHAPTDGTNDTNDTAPRMKISSRTARFDTKKSFWTFESLEIEDGRTRLIAKDARYDPREKLVVLEQIEGRYQVGTAGVSHPASGATQTRVDRDFALRAREGTLAMTDEFTLRSATLRSVELEKIDTPTRATAASATVAFGDAASADDSTTLEVRLIRVKVDALEGSAEIPECTLRLAR